MLLAQVEDLKVTNVQLEGHFGVDTTSGRCIVLIMMLGGDGQLIVLRVQTHGNANTMAMNVSAAQCFPVCPLNE